MKTTSSFLNCLTRILFLVLVATVPMVPVTAFTQDGSEITAKPIAEMESQFVGGLKRISQGNPRTLDWYLPGAPENAFNYTFSTATTASLTNMSSGTTQLLAADIDDTASALTNIGFEFFFQGSRFTQFSINENGVVRLGGIAQTSIPYKPLAQAGLPIITAYGADQRTHAGDGKVHFKVIGTAPNRTLVIEWLNNQANFNTGGTADLTYQVRLYETTGLIEFVYGSMTMSTQGAISLDSKDPNIGFSSSNDSFTVGSVTAAQSGTPRAFIQRLVKHPRCQSLYGGPDHRADLGSQRFQTNLQFYTANAGRTDWADLHRHHSGGDDAQLDGFTE